MGRLVRDPELKHLQNGTAVTNFGIAVSETFKKQDGSKGENVSFIDLEAWASGAEAIAKFFKKGDPIIVTAKVKQENWEKDGQKHSKIKFRVEQFYFLLSKPGEGKGGESHASNSTPSTDKPAEVQGGDEQIPF